MLVTDGHLRPSLAIVRSLGRAGYLVYVCAPARKSLAGASRYAVDQAEVPDPLSQPQAFADAVVALTGRWHVQVLIPVSEEALLVLLPAAARMPDVCVPFPPLETFRKASDKGHVTALAATLGLAVPEQVVMRDRAGARDLPVERLRFPVVLKPARSVGGEGADRVKHGVSYANDRTEYDRLVTALPASAFPLLVQQRIDGPGTGVFLLVWRDEVIARFAHRRIREKPPSGGVSVCAESIAADPVTVEQSRALLAALHWSGPAMVEYKEDQVTGRRYLMEINGRFWGSLQLAVDAGVDFPTLLVSAALGNRPVPVTQYALGVRGRWWWGEVDHLLARLRGASAPGVGGRANAVRAFLRPGPGIRNEVLRADDPWPFVRETIEWLHGR